MTDRHSFNVFHATELQPRGRVDTFSACWLADALQRLTDYSPLIRQSKVIGLTANYWYMGGRRHFNEAEILAALQEVPASCGLVLSDDFRSLLLSASTRVEVGYGVTAPV